LISASIFVPFGHYDEPETLSYAIPLICPIGADVRQVKELANFILTDAFAHHMNAAQELFVLGLLLWAPGPLLLAVSPYP
jgi:hypothetical protein